MRSEEWWWRRTNYIAPPFGFPTSPVISTGVTMLCDLKAKESLSDFILGRVMTKQCIKILMKSDSANESAFPWSLMNTRLVRNIRFSRVYIFCGAS